MRLQEILNFAKNIILREVLLTSKFINKLTVFLFNRMIGKFDHLTNYFNSDSKYAYQLGKLKKEGLVLFDRLLYDDQVERIRSKIENLDCTNFYIPSFGTFKYNNAPQDSHVAEYFRSDLIKITEIIELANNPEILCVVQEFLGCKPIISNINIWWSYSNRVSPQYAQNFHRDYDDIKFLKLFIYLTDVDESSGPHVYVANSSGSSHLRRPSRHDDNVIKQLFGSSFIAITGKKGSGFLEDTFGIHKGELPLKRDRLLLQIEYSINPLLSEKYEKVSIDDIANKKIDKYINQLLVDFN